MKRYSLVSLVKQDKSPMTYKCPKSFKLSVKPPCKSTCNPVGAAVCCGSTLCHVWLRRHNLMEGFIVTPTHTTSAVLLMKHIYPKIIPFKFRLNLSLPTPQLQIICLRFCWTSRNILLTAISKETSLLMGFTCRAMTTQNGGDL